MESVVVGGDEMMGVWREEHVTMFEETRGERNTFYLLYHVINLFWTTVE